MPTFHLPLFLEYKEWARLGVTLGVKIHDRLSFNPSIENLISRFAQMFYARPNV